MAGVVDVLVLMLVQEFGLRTWVSAVWMLPILVKRQDPYDTVQLEAQTGAGTVQYAQINSADPVAGINGTQRALRDKGGVEWYATCRKLSASGGGRADWAEDTERSMIAFLGQFQSFCSGFFRLVWNYGSQNQSRNQKSV